MKLEFQENFSRKLARIIAYIAADKPKAARRFKSELLNELERLVDYPKLGRTSELFEDDTVREFFFKGYTIFYALRDQQIIVFSILKHDLFEGQSDRD